MYLYVLTKTFTSLTVELLEKTFNLFDGLIHHRPKPQVLILFVLHARIGVAVLAGEQHFNLKIIILKINTHTNELECNRNIDLQCTVYC